MSTENVVEYSLFFVESVDIKFLLKQVQSSIKELCDGYIWQKQGCDVNIADSPVSGMCV